MRRIHWRVGAVVLGLFVAHGAVAAPASAGGGKSKDNRLKIGKTDIGGEVRSWKGREAGVWVIAETDDFGTRYAKIVVTDEKGRFLIPDLPKATYDVWVRGYGLVDSPKITTHVGQRRDLQAAIAPSKAAAAQYYPANYWLSLLEAPDESAFPIGTLASQAHWVQNAKSDIIRYQYGGPFHRGLTPENPAYADLGPTTTFDLLRYMEDAGQMPEWWPGRSDPVEQAYADWIDGIWDGELPPAPPRPQGRERDVVVTTWDAADETAFVHDVISTDKRNPTVNADGEVYGGEFHNDTFAIVDPEANTDELIPIPTIVDRTLIPTFTRTSGWTHPSPTWGDEQIIFDAVRPNGITMDEKGRVWNTANIHNDAPAFCRPGATNKYAQIDPTTGNGGLDFATYDPATEAWELINTCYGGQHATMSVVGPNRVFMNGGNSRFLWVDTNVWDATHDEEASQGWCRLFYDADGDGDGDRDFPVNGSPYGPQQSSLDGSIWGAVQTVPGRIVRLDLGDNPPETCVGEAYNVPFDPFPSSDSQSQSGFFSRGIDVDSHGVVWTGLSGSGTLASFDRRKCKGPLTGPEAITGDHCPEGWTLYPTPGPRIENTPFSADFHYYNFVDQYGVVGLGKDLPLVNGTNSDAVHALVRPKKGKKAKDAEWITFRLPYPVGGLYQRGMDVRMDDPKGGWKGRGLWVTNGTRAVWFNEFGKGARGLIAKFQLRPDPLAR